MGSGGVTIVVLSSVICLKVLFSDGLGGVKCKAGETYEYNLYHRRATLRSEGTGSHSRGKQKRKRLHRGKRLHRHIGNRTPSDTCHARNIRLWEILQRRPAHVTQSIPPDGKTNQKRQRIYRRSGSCPPTVGHQQLF